MQGDSLGNMCLAQGKTHIYYTRKIDGERYSDHVRSANGPYSPIGHHD